MPEKWTGEVVGTMHVNRISYQELADIIGWHVKYLSAVMNGHRKPTGAERMVKDALDAILSEKGSEE